MRERYKEFLRRSYEEKEREEEEGLRAMPSTSSVVVCGMCGWVSCSLRSGMPPLEEPSMRKRYTVVLSEPERARLHTLSAEAPVQPVP